MKEKDMPYAPHLISEEIGKIVTEYKKNQQKVVEYGANLIENGDVILMYDHSTTVGKMLLFAKESGKSFEVIIAKQAEEKTKENIEFCFQQGIRFRVIPTYMLTHIEDTITKVFTGAVTLKSTFKFIMDPGTMAVISEFTLKQKPMYVFLQTTKFSLWEDSGAVHDVHIKEKTIPHDTKDLQYDFMSFSHDRINMHRFDRIITEEGVFTPQEMEKIFTKKFVNRKKLKSQILAGSKK